MCLCENWSRGSSCELSMILHDSEHRSNVCAVSVCARQVCLFAKCVAACVFMHAHGWHRVSLVCIGGSESLRWALTYNYYQKKKLFPLKSSQTMGEKEELIKTSWPPFKYWDCWWNVDEQLCYLRDKRAPQGLCLCSGFIYLQNLTEKSSLKAIKTYSAH